MKLLLTFLITLSAYAQNSTWVDRTITKDGLEYCQADSGDRAFYVVLKDEDGRWLEDQDKYMQVWEYATDKVETYRFVRRVFQGRAFRNSKGVEIQTHNPNHVNLTSFSFINLDGTQGVRDSSPYLPSRPSCGEYVSN